MKQTVLLGAVSCDARDSPIPDAPGDPQMTPPSFPIDLRGSVVIIDDIGGPYGPPRPFHCGPPAAAPLVLMMHHRHKSVR